MWGIGPNKKTVNHMTVTIRFSSIEFYKYTKIKSIQGTNQDMI